MSQLATEWRELRATGRLVSFVVLCLGVWLHAADSFLAATTMPAAVQEIGGVAFINWAIALYLLGAIVSGAAVGVMARRLGLRNLLIVAAVVYALGCAVSALAPDIGVLLVGRLIQGTGGGVMIALTYVATQRLFPEHLWVRLMAIVSAIWGASSLCGPMIGGAFADAGLWRGAFWAFGAQAVLLIVAALVFLRDLPAERREASSWPWPPLLVLALGTLAIAAAGDAGTWRMSALLGLIGVAALYGAARIDRARAIRVMPVELLRPRHPVGAGLIMVLTLAAGSAAFTSYGPLLLELLFGVSPLVAGYILAAESVAWTIGTLMTSGFGPASEPLLIRGGASLIGLGGIGLAAFVSNGPLFPIVLSVTLQGFGYGICWPFIVRRIVVAASPGERDLAASATSSMQRIGYALGASASGIAANAVGLGHETTRAVAESAGIWVFVSFLPVLAIGAAAAWQ
ncbi:MAG: MFS transporter, partial [Acetobacteraceae bacterium]